MLTGPPPKFHGTRDILCQPLLLYPLAVGGVESFDQCLLALDALQGQMPIAGRCGELGASVHEPHPKHDTALSGFVRIVSAMNAKTSTSTEVDRFFDRYAAALLARDAKAIANLYAVPALIVFPGQLIQVSDASQTEEFFAASWSQYQGVDSVDKQIVIMGEATASVWADVTWSYGGEARERFCYQLVTGADEYRIAVLTPLA